MSDKNILWMPIPGFVNYDINQHGVIRKSLNSNHKNAGEIKSIFVRKNGYSQVILYKDGKKKRFLIHCLVALVFVGDKPTDDHEVAHLDGNRLNNFYKNLAWKTHKENELDKVIHGSILRGEDVGTAKLTNKNVLEIKKRLISGEKQADIAKDYLVHASTISLIHRNKFWRHI